VTATFGCYGMIYRIDWIRNFFIPKLSFYLVNVSLLPIEEIEINLIKLTKQLILENGKEEIGL